jgi:hypothetical protein
MTNAAAAEKLRAGLAQMQGAREATLALVAGLDDTRAARVPEGGGWSAAQILDHLRKTDAVYRGEIAKLFELRASGRPPVREIGLRELNTRPPFVPAALLPFLDLPFRIVNRFVPSGLREYLTGVPLIPFGAPDAAQPEPQGGIDALRKRLKASCEETTSLLAERDVSGMIVDHPLLGRNGIPALIRILARHEDRHRQQISRVLSAQPRQTHTEDKAVNSANATTTGGPQASNGPASARLQGFADDAEEALSTGRQIVSWWRGKMLEDALELFPLKPAYPPYFEMQRFFDKILLLGDMKPTSIMGCLQHHRFKRRRPPVAEATRHLESFIDQHFLAKCLRTRPDGKPGGFRYRPICFKEKDGRLSEPEDPQALGADLASLRHGPREWGVFQVDILDFVRVNPMLANYDAVLSRFIRESAYIVIHEDLALAPTKAPKGVIAERRFGYAFLPRAVEHNIFGFGPGKFGAAIKQWRFLLFLNGDVEVQVAFVVAPRSQKVLDIGGFDPIYASIHLADAFSLGVLGLRESGHAALDAVFLEHHGSVHADVVMGLQEIWEGQRWVPSFGSW